MPGEANDMTNPRPEKKGSALARMAGRNILFLGLVSFFADVSSEMVYPLIPLYLTAAFGATPLLVGLVEGIAESLASLLKVFSGYLSDRYDRKKPLAFFGYATGLVYKLALIFASSWGGVLAARVIDRFGKGLRTAPRDVMVAQSAPEGKGGRAFGIHKAMDMAGSALGILLSYFLLRGLGESAEGFRATFALSAIPVVLALLMFFFIREQRRPGERREPPRLRDMHALPRRLKLYLLVAFLFTLGNSSNTFLLLKANDIGFSDAQVVLLYFLYSLTASMLSIPFGMRSDRVGRKQVLVAGYLVFALVYLGFAFTLSRPVLLGAFLLYGAYTAMVAGVERAFIAEIAPDHLRGTMLGLHATLLGVALLPASLIAGFLWTAFGSWAPFTFGAALSLAAAAVLHRGLRVSA